MITLFRALERVPPVLFLWLTVLAIVATRVAIIVATPVYRVLISAQPSSSEPSSHQRACVRST